MSRKTTSTIAPLAAGASVLGLCCGVPLLASAGVLGAIAGIGLGSWLIVGVAAVIVVIGLVRSQRAKDSNQARLADDSPSSAMHDNHLSPTRPYIDEEEYS